MTYRVVSPLVSLKVPGPEAGWRYQHYYAGAVVPEGVDKECLKRHVDDGLVVGDGVPDAAFAVPSGTPVPASIEEAKAEVEEPKGKPGPKPASR